MNKSTKITQPCLCLYAETEDKKIAGSPDEHLPQITRELAVDKLLGARQLRPPNAAGQIGTQP